MFFITAAVFATARFDFAIWFSSGCWMTSGPSPRSSWWVRSIGHSWRLGGITPEVGAESPSVRRRAFCVSTRIRLENDSGQRIQRAGRALRGAFRRPARPLVEPRFPRADGKALEARRRPRRARRGLRNRTLGHAARIGHARERARHGDRSRAKL